MAKKKSTEKIVKEKTEVVVAFKGFDAELKCRGFQYQVGSTYEHKGSVSACESGFHACVNPLDVLSYYPLLSEDAKPNRFAVVEQSGKLDRDADDSKIASASITITAELTIPEFVRRAVTWATEHCAKDAKEGETAASGHCSKLAASGHCSQLAASGNYSQLAASGDCSKLAASGHCSKLAASGDYSQLAASGHCSKLAASGHCSKLAASGDCSQLAASGNYSKLAASGDCSQLAASGHCSKLAASGDCSQLAASGENSVITSSSYSGTAMGAAGTWISLAEYDRDGKCVGFATGCIGNDGLKPDTWYRASGGKLVVA
jgi:hypothetical protein